MKPIVNQPKNIAVLGCTGSIGTQTLDIVDKHPELYRASVLAAGRRVDELIGLARHHRPDLAVIADESALPRLRDALEPLGIRTAAGASALAEAAEEPGVEMVVTATVGYSGLEPTIRAIRAGKDIALANKETLVVAGDYVRRLLEKSPSRVYPVDSEHSAVYQCLAGERRNKAALSSPLPEDRSAHGVANASLQPQPRTHSSIPTGTWARKSPLTLPR